MKSKFFIILIFLLVLSACGLRPTEMDAYDDVVDSIAKPSNQILEIEGSYAIKSMEPLGEVNEESIKRYEDKPNLYISPDLVKFGDLVSQDPKFKSRYLDFSKLIKSTNIEAEGLENLGQGQVYTISDGQFLYQNFFVIDEKSLAMVSDGILFKFEKFSEKVGDDIYKSAEKKVENRLTKDNMDEEKRQKLALIGLKKPEKDTDGNTYFNYYTILIHEDVIGDFSAYAINGLFIADKNSFYLAGMVHEDKDQAQDLFYLESLASGESKKEYYKIGDGEANHILYIDDEYLCIETKNYGSIPRKYRLYKLSRLDEENSLSVKDIAGDKGLDSFIDSTARTISKNNIEAQTIDLVDIYNLGLTRNKGQWLFKSNLIIPEDEKIVVTDYTLDIVPNIEIADDEISLGWDQIQNMFPGSIDAYTSPDKSMIIVQKSQELVVHPLKNGIIGKRHKLAISLEELDRIVMSSWVEGPRVDELMDVFLKEDRLILQTIK